MHCALAPRGSFVTSGRRYWRALGYVILVHSNYGVNRLLGGLMNNQNISNEKQKPGLADLIMTGVVVALIIAAVILAYSYRQSITKTLKELSNSPLAIATQPEGATILLDGVIIGTSPITVKTSSGAHTVMAKKAGYVTTSSAIDLEMDSYEGLGSKRSIVYRAKPWIVNYKLHPSPISTQSIPPSKVVPDVIKNKVTQLQFETTLSSVDANNSIGALSNKIINLEQDNSQLREEVRELRGIWIQFLSFSTAILLSLLGIAVTIFLTRRSS